MPSPPDFLLKQAQANLNWEEPDIKDVIQAQEDLDQWAKGSLFAESALENQSFTETGTTSPIPPEEITAIPNSFSTATVTVNNQPRAVDYLAYQQAIEDRISAETSYAEIYSKYLEILNFNEKTLRSLRRYQNYKKKMRILYDRALLGDQNLKQDYKTLSRNLAATERVLSELQMENEALRISLSSHQEAYKGSLAQLSLQQEERDLVKREFQTMAQEYENRGIIIEEADRKIRGYLTQIEQLEISLTENQNKFIAAYDGALLSHNKMRELEIRETGVSALNEELAQALTKSQKQIQDLETKLKYQNEAACTRILSLEQEVTRLRENRDAETLVEKSKAILKPKEDPVRPKPAVPPAQAMVPKNKKQWDDFYDRWSNIIDGLSSHSVPIDKLSNPGSETSDIHLLSDGGDFEIL